MTRDYEVRRKLWEGKVPVQFILDAPESIHRSTKPYFAMLSRTSYFPLILPRVLQFFGTAVEQIEPESVWLQHGTVPVKWHYPIGVLFDLLKSDDALPWIVTVRTTDFPKELVRWSRDAMESSFIQSIKEADYLKHKAAVVHAMKEEEHRRLWLSFANEQFDDYWLVNEKLVASEDPILHVPIRLYRAGHPFRQLLITPKDENGRPRTLADACLAAGFDTDFVAISHGIEMPSDTPLLWMTENYSYPDNFVHVVIRIHS